MVRNRVGPRFISKIHKIRRRRRVSLTVVVLVDDGPVRVTLKTYFGPFRWKNQSFPVVQVRNRRARARLLVRVRLGSIDLSQFLHSRGVPVLMIFLRLRLARRPTPSFVWRVPLFPWRTAER